MGFIFGLRPCPKFVVTVCNASYIYIYIYIYMCVCVYIYIYIFSTRTSKTDMAKR